MSEFFSQYAHLLIPAVTSAFFSIFGVIVASLVQRKKYKIEVEKLKIETRKTEIEIKGAEKLQDFKILDENITSMKELVDFVQAMGGNVINLQKEVTALKKENLKVTTERDSCQTLCDRLKKEVKQLSAKVSKLEVLVKKHNIPLEAQ